METKQAAQCQALSLCSHAQPCTLQGLRMGKNRIQFSDSWFTDQRNDFNEPRLLHLPPYRKVPNSLTREVYMGGNDSLFLWKTDLLGTFDFVKGTSMDACSVMSSLLRPRGL